MRIISHIMGTSIRKELSNRYLQPSKDLTTEAPYKQRCTIAGTSPAGRPRRCHNPQFTLPSRNLETGFFGTQRTLGRGAGFYPTLSASSLQNVPRLSIINNWLNLRVFSSVSTPVSHFVFSVGDRAKARPRIHMREWCSR